MFVLGLHGGGGWMVSVDLIVPKLNFIAQFLLLNSNICTMRAILLLEFNFKKIDGFWWKYTGL